MVGFVQDICNDLCYVIKCRWTFINIISRLTCWKTKNFVLFLFLIITLFLFSTITLIFQLLLLFLSLSLSTHYPFLQLLPYFFVHRLPKQKYSKMEIKKSTSLLTKRKKKIFCTGLDSGTSLISTGTRRYTRYVWYRPVFRTVREHLCMCAVLLPIQVDTVQDLQHVLNIYVLILKLDDQICGPNLYFSVHVASRVENKKPHVI